MSAQINACDYLRNQKDKQLHLIADMCDQQMTTIHNLRKQYDELLKSSVELAEFYGNVDNWWGNGVFYYNKIDSSDESSSEDLDANSVVGGKRARDFLKKVRGE